MKIRSIFFQHAMKAFILLGFTIYILFLVRTDKISYYIAPHMEKFIAWSSLIFFAMAVYQMYRAIRSRYGQVNEVSCDCGHDHPSSDSMGAHIVIYGLFVFPLLLGFLLPDTMMGSSLAAKKGMNLSTSSLVKKADVNDSTSTSETTSLTQVSPEPKQLPSPETVTDEQLDALFVFDVFSKAYAIYGKQLYRADEIVVSEQLFIETLTTVDLYLDNFIGKKMTLQGFVYRQDNMKPEQFVLGRFAIQCCAADGSPMGVMIEDKNANQFATDSWIRATGTIEKTIFNNVPIIQLKLESYEAIPEPKTKYVYINYDFGF